MPEETPNPIIKILSVGKDALPWITLLATSVYGYAVRTGTSDRALQQSQEDHVAMLSMQQAISELKADEKGMAAKVDLLIEQMFSRNQKQ